MNIRQRSNAPRVTGAATALAAGLAAFVPQAANAADALLSGTVASSAGEKMGGVTISAKAEGSLITTTVYTDEAGAYYFPPLPQGKYKVWAQAISFETTKGDVNLASPQNRTSRSIRSRITMRGSGNCRATSSTPRCPRRRSKTLA